MVNWAERDEEGIGYVCNSNIRALLFVLAVVVFSTGNSNT